MMKILSLSVAVLFCAILLKERNKTFAVLLSLAGAVLLFGTCIGEIRSVISGIDEISSSAFTSSKYIRLMMKVLAITVMTGFVSDICRDNGESAVASMTETAAKIIIISLVLPLFETVITIVSELVK